MPQLFSYATGKLRFKTANSLAVPYDPVTFSVTLYSPKGITSVYTYVETPPPASTVTRVAFGEFIALIPDTLLIPGRWRGRVRAIDPGDTNRVDISEFSFTVEHSRVVTNA